MKLSRKSKVIIGISLMIGSIVVFALLPERPLGVKIATAVVFSAGMAFFGYVPSKSSRFYPPLNTDQTDNNLNSEDESSSDKSRLS